METILLVFLFLLFSSVREFLHYRQTMKLQELLKSLDISDYYNAKKLSQKPRSENVIMEEEENPIAYNDPDFDIKKVTKVTIDGQEKEINIIP